MKSILPSNSRIYRFSSACGTPAKTDRVLGQRTNLSRFIRIEIIRLFSDHNGIKLEMNNRNKKKISLEIKQCISESPGPQKNLQRKWKNTYKQMTVQKNRMWGVSQAGVRGRFTAASAYPGNAEREQSRNR